MSWLLVDLVYGVGKPDHQGKDIRASQKALELLSGGNRTRSPAEKIVSGFLARRRHRATNRLRYPKKLGGIMALSPILRWRTQLPAERSEANAAIPIYMATAVKIKYSDC